MPGSSSSSKTSTAPTGKPLAITPVRGEPIETADGLRDMAIGRLDAEGSLAAAGRLALAQGIFRDRLTELGVFWRRLAAAWASVHPQLTDRRELDALSRNALRRLSLKDLYTLPGS
jgi:hypothetical protein